MGTTGSAQTLAARVTRGLRCNLAGADRRLGYRRAPVGRIRSAAAGRSRSARGCGRCASRNCRAPARGCGDDEGANDAWSTRRAPPPRASGAPSGWSCGCPPHGHQLPAVRAMAGDLAMRMDFDLDAVEDLRLAVDEACATLASIALGRRAADRGLRGHPRRACGSRPGCRRPPGSTCRATASAGRCCRPWWTRSRPVRSDQATVPAGNGSATPVAVHRPGQVAAPVQRPAVRTERSDADVSVAR